MKKFYLAVAAACFYFGAIAQVVEVSSVSEVILPPGMEAIHATLSPNGDFLLITDAGYKGLQKYDLNTKQLSTITDAEGAGYNPLILNDGKTIVYRETSFTKDNLRKSELKSKDLSTGTVETLVKPTRDLEGVMVKDNSIYMVNKGKVATKSMTRDAKTNSSLPILSINNRQLMLTKNGETTTLSPNGTDKSYIWPSLSPDGSKILYYVGGVGAYICNIDGSNVTLLGALRAPKWYNNNIVVGMRDRNSDYDVVSSSVIAKDITTKTEQILSDSSVVAMYPSVSNNGDKILFSTPLGKAYIINVKTK